MTKRFSLYLFTVLCTLVAFTSCSNDDAFDSSAYDGTYTNKTSASTTNLTLTYSDVELQGKDIIFKMTSATTADLTFIGILPGEVSTKVEGVKVENLYTSYSDVTPAIGFSGSAISTLGTSFNYNGSINDGNMTFAITNVKLASNPITAQGLYFVQPYNGEQAMTDSEVGEYTLYSTAVRLKTDNATLQDLSTIVNDLGGQILANILRDVKFREDGNIVASYFPATTLEEMLVPHEDSEFLTSPINLATYYVNGGSIFVTPNISAIIAQVESDKSRSTIAPEDITKIMALIKKWANTGIELKYTTEFPFEETDNGYIKYEGDLYVYLDREEIAPIIELLPVIKGLLSAETQETYGEMIDQIYAGFKECTVFNLGIILKK